MRSSLFLIPVFLYLLVFPVSASADFTFNSVSYPDFPVSYTAGQPNTACFMSIYVGVDDNIYINWINTINDNPERDQCSDPYYSQTFSQPKLIDNLLVPLRYSNPVNQHRVWNGTTWAYTEFWPEVPVKDLSTTPSNLMTDYTISIGTYSISANWGLQATPTPIPFINTIAEAPLDAVTPALPAVFGGLSAVAGSFFVIGKVRGILNL